MNTREMTLKMSQHWLKIKDWWNTLALREKQAVAIGGALLTVFLLYAGIWSPYVDHVAAMRDKIQSEEKLLAWMQSADNDIRRIEKQSGQTVKSVTPVVLLGLLQSQIDKAGLAGSLTQLKQSGNAAIEMHFQKVAFDKLSGLLLAVVRKNNVAVTQLSAVSDNTPGEVNADIILSTG